MFSGCFWTSRFLEKGMATHSSILAWRIPMDRRAWRATVHRVTKCQTQLMQLSRKYSTIWWSRVKKNYGNIRLFAIMEKMIHGKTGSLFLSLSLTHTQTHTHHTPHTTLQDGETLCSEAAPVDSLIVYTILYCNCLFIFILFLFYCKCPGSRTCVSSSLYLQRVLCLYMADINRHWTNECS